MSNRENVDSSIEWTETIKKEARGIDELDLGEVQQVELENIVTQKGNIEKEQFRIPKKFVDRFDGSVLWFNLDTANANIYSLKRS